MADSTITMRLVAEGNLQSGAAKTSTATPNPNHAPTSPATIADATATAVARENRKTQTSGASNGKSLGSFVSGMLLHEGFSSAVGAYANLNPGRRREANYAAQIGGGAIAGATAGAMVGGPIGAAIGGALGAATGALTAFAEEVKNTREALAEITNHQRSFSLSHGARRQDDAFVKSLSLMTRDEKLSAISDRAATLYRGNGELSIENLENWLKDAANAGNTDTEDYKRKQQDLQMQYGRLGQLAQLDDKIFFQDLPRRVSASDFGDNLSKMGGSVGAAVDVDTTNRDMLDISRQILSVLKSLATRSVDTTYGIDSAGGPLVPTVVRLY